MASMTCAGDVSEAGALRHRIRHMSPARWPMLRLLVVLAAWCLPLSSFAAITVDTPNVSNATANAASLTWSHTVGAGANRILIVGTSHRGNSTISGVTYGGHRPQPDRTRLRTSGGDTTALWYLLAPPQGTATSSSRSAAARRIVGGAVTFFGVDQTTPHGTYVSATGTSTTASVTATSAAGELVIDTVAANGNAGTVAAAGGQTELWNAGHRHRRRRRPRRRQHEGRSGVRRHVLDVGVTTRAWAIGAVPLKPVPLSGHGLRGRELRRRGGARQDHGFGGPARRHAGRAVRRGGQLRLVHDHRRRWATTRSAASPPATTRCASSTPR